MGLSSAHLGVLAIATGLTLAAAPAATVMAGIPDPNNPYLSSSALRLNDDGTVIGPIIAALSGMDDYRTVVDLPFSLNFGGAAFDALCVNTNAYLSLTQQGAEGCGGDTYNEPITVMLDGSQNRPVIAAISADQNLAESFGMVPDVYDRDPAITSFTTIGSIFEYRYARVATDIVHGIHPGNNFRAYGAPSYCDVVDSAWDLNSLLTDQRFASEPNADLSPLRPNELIVQFSYSCAPQNTHIVRWAQAIPPYRQRNVIARSSDGLVIGYPGSQDRDRTQPGQCVIVTPTEGDPYSVPTGPLRVQRFGGASFEDSRSKIVSAIRAEDEANFASLSSTSVRLFASDCYGAPNNVHYGFTEIDGRRAVVLTWYRIRWYQPPDPENQSVTSQIVLIERDTLDDTNGKNFDIEFNFASIVAESTEWPPGYANCAEVSSESADGCTFHFAVGLGWGDPLGNRPESGIDELFGSTESRQLLDSNPSTGLVFNSLNTDVLGRYTWLMEAGNSVNFAPPVMGGQATFGPGSAPTVTPPVATANGAGALVSWAAATPGLSGPVTSYTLAVVGFPNLGCTVAAPATSCAIPGLGYGTPYTFTVSATSAQGAVSQPSGPSSPLTLTEPAEPPPNATPPPPPPPSPRSLPPATLVPTQVATPFIPVPIVASGFDSEEPVVVYVGDDDDLQVIGNLTSSESGEVEVEVVIPLSVCGDTSLVVYAPGSGTGYRQDVAVDGCALPATGTTTSAPSWVACASVALGWLLVAQSKRRRFIRR